MIDVFRIGVHIGMTSNASQVLGVMLRQLTGVHTATGHINTNLSTMAKLAVSAGAALAGGAVLRGLWDVVSASKELNDELTRTVQLGGDFAAKIDQIRATAFNVAATKVPTATPAQLVRIQRELGTQLNSPEEAMAVLPHAARLAYVLQHYTGKDADEAIRDAVKVADMRGAIFARGESGEERVDPQKLTAEMDAMAAGIRASGGLLSPHDFLMFARQAGLAGKLMDPKAFYALSAEAMIAMGAGRAGTAQTSLFQQLIGSTMPVHVAKEMERMGLVKPGEWRSDHGHIIMDKSATARLGAISNDPFKWINDTLVPQLEAMGLHGEDLLKEIFRLFGRQTTQRFVAEVVQNKAQFERVAHLFDGVLGVDDTYDMLIDKNLTANVQAFSSAWKGLMQSMGDAGIPPTIALLHSLTTALHTMTGAVEAHPEVARLLMELAAALAALALVGGTIGILAIAFRGLAPVLVALRLLAGETAIATLGPGLVTVATGLSTLIGPVRALLLLLGILKLGSDHETPENRKALEDLEKSRRVTPPILMIPQDGYTVDGRPIIVRNPEHHQADQPSTHPPRDPEHHQADVLGAADQGLVSTIAAAVKHALAGLSINLDGRKAGEIVMGHMADELGRPNTGSLSPSVSAVPLMPGYSTIQ